MERRNKVYELGKSFITLVLLAVGLGLAVGFGILLMPVVVAYIFVLAIREVFIWKRKSRGRDRNSTISQTGSTTIISSSSMEAYQKAA